MAFGVFGHTQPWKFSKWIYNLTNPSEKFLHDHFDRIQKFCSSGGAIASKKARAYRIHPFFAGLSLISSALLTFGSPSKISNILPSKHWWP